MLAELVTVAKSTGPTSHNHSRTFKKEGLLTLSPPIRRAVFLGTFNSGPVTRTAV